MLGAVSGQVVPREDECVREAPDYFRGDRLVPVVDCYVETLLSPGLTISVATGGQRVNAPFHAPEGSS